MSKRNERSLIIIGGHENKNDNKLILREVARRTAKGKLVSYAFPAEFCPYAAHIARPTQFNTRTNQDYASGPSIKTVHQNRPSKP